MLKLPGRLTAETFLQHYWQKQPLFMPAALQKVRPSITRNELGWLATLEDVESRLVFVDRGGPKVRYRTESGPFESHYLAALPKRDWTLLVHDVEKHLPTMRALFKHIPFIPDWRIDDLLVSFAAPGGGVGPHRDHYDVFLCQGIGVRNWRFTGDDVIENPDASDDLALLNEFDGGGDNRTQEGDVLYLPPGAAHWGTARRACMTYSIGMRAPQASDIAFGLSSVSPDGDRFYRDPDLKISEALTGHISRQSVHRALALPGVPNAKHDQVAKALGRFATQTKAWLKPEVATTEEIESMLERLRSGGRLTLHGMAQIAFDDRQLYVNGNCTHLPQGAAPILAEICATRSLSHSILGDDEHAKMLEWMLRSGAFEIPEIS